MMCRECLQPAKHVAGDVYYCARCNRNRLYRELVVQVTAGAGRMFEWFDPVKPRADEDKDVSNG